MSINNFIKPTWKKIGLTVILIILFYFIFGYIKIFECTTQPVVLNPPEPVKTFCGSPLSIVLGASIHYTWLGILTAIIIFIIIPYIISLIIFELIRKK